MDGLGVRCWFADVDIRNIGRSLLLESASEHSIAVLPLVNMSPDEDNIYFASGVHEDILAGLSKIDGLQVISRTSILRYMASTLTVPEIGRELAARYVVEGSVRRFENQVRVTIQLIDARADHHLWASNFERELANVFETQSELAREISNPIQLQIAPETIRSLQGKPTTSALAYDLYQKAVSIEKSEGETEASTVRRRKLLEQAVKEDSEFVEAWGPAKAHLRPDAETHSAIRMDLRLPRCRSAPDRPALPLGPRLGQGDQILECAVRRALSAR